MEFGHLSLYLVLTGAGGMGPGQQACLNFISWYSDKIPGENNSGEKEFTWLAMAVYGSLLQGSQGGRNLKQLVTVKRTDEYMLLLCSGSSLFIQSRAST